MSRGIKISLPGYDVNTAAPEQCAVHSDYPNPKIKSGQSPAHFDVLPYTFSSDPADGTYDLFTIAHGCSYTPNAICFTKDHSFAPARFSILPAFLDGLAAQQYLCYFTDGTNLVIRYSVANNGMFGHVNVNGLQLTFKYYIFVEDGTTFP